MSSYVPPHLRNRAPRASPTPSVSGPSPSRTFGSASSTMASLTRHTGKASSSVAPTISDFPVLSQAVEVSQQKQSNQSVWSNSNKSFATLSRDWGVHQKEQEEQEKRRAKEKLTQEQLEKEKKNKELSYYCVDVVNSTRLIYGISQNERRNRRMDDMKRMVI